MPQAQQVKTRTYRLPIITGVQANAFNSGRLNEQGSYILNGVVLQYPDGGYYVTQRPGLAVFQDPADSSFSPSPGSKGRGVFSWNSNGPPADGRYIINDTKVYHETYASPLTNTITSGYLPLEMRDLRGQLVFLDSENNEMYYISSGDSTKLRSMQSPAPVVLATVTFDATALTIASTTASAWSSLDLELGDHIEVSGATDPENNTSVGAYFTVDNISVDGKTITLISGRTLNTLANEASGATVTITKTSFSALPQNQSKTLAHGLEVLDGRMYVLDTESNVWGCDLLVPGNYDQDIQGWDNGLNFVTCNKSSDQSVALAKHYDNLVVFGTRTIEFLFNAGNPSPGSTLGVRDDISYNVGCADPHSIWRNGDELYFLGIDTSGQIAPYVLSQFQIKPLLSTSGSSFLTYSLGVESGIHVIGSGLSSGNNTYYILTVYQVNSNSMVPTGSFVYNSNTQMWSEWQFSGISGLVGTPLVGFTISDTTRRGEGCLSDGRLIFVADNYRPFDTIAAGPDGYVEAGYVGADYVFDDADTASNNAITLKIRLDNWDNNNRDWKFAHQLRFVGDATEQSQDLLVRWCDNKNTETVYTAFNDKTIDVSSPLNKLTRLGRFKSRSFELEYSGTEQLRIEALDIDITEGSH